jgi:hypothetical protein
MEFFRVGETLKTNTSAKSKSNGEGGSGDGDDGSQSDLEPRIFETEAGQIVQVRHLTAGIHAHAHRATHRRLSRIGSTAHYWQRSTGSTALAAQHWQHSCDKICMFVIKVCVH